jgi:hypothetical protein
MCVWVYPPAGWCAHLAGADALLGAFGVSVDLYACFLHFEDALRETTGRTGDCEESEREMA